MEAQWWSDGYLLEANINNRKCCGEYTSSYGENRTAEQQRTGGGI